MRSLKSDSVEEEIDIETGVSTPRDERSLPRNYSFFKKEFYQRARAWFKKWSVDLPQEPSLADYLQWTKINKKYTKVSNKLTVNYETVFGLPCDIFLPINATNPDSLNDYDKTNLFNIHSNVTYPTLPNVSRKFYIPFLLKKKSMDSSELEFDSFYLEDEDQRPFIETKYDNSLPISTKVVVHVEESIMQFVIDKKLVINGAGGHMLLRMYLIPLNRG